MCSALRVLIIIGVALWASASATAQPLELKLEVSPVEATIDDTISATVLVVVAGLSGAERYWHPDFEDFKVLDSQVKRSTESEIDPNIGQRLRHIERHTYLLQPTRVGRLRISGAKVRLAGQEYESSSVVVKVLPTSSTGISQTAVSGSESLLDVPGFEPPDGIHREDVFLYGVPSKPSVFVGEQVTITWLLYARKEVLKYEAKPPQLSGLWSEVLFEPDAYFTYRDARVGRLEYVVAIVSKRAFFPTEPGELVIAPFEARIATVGTALGRTDRVRSNPIRIEVKPFPEGAPARFEPTYVGSFTAAATVDRDLVQAGESFTLTLRIRGRGAVRRTSPPQLELPGFKVRAPRDFEEQSQNEGDAVGGERVYRYWTTPTIGGDLTLPAIELPFFNPESGTYEIARTTPIAITVQGDPSALDPDLAEENAPRIIDRDIRLIHSADGIDSRIMVQLYESRWFWGLFAVAPLMFVVVLTTDRVRRRLKRESPRARVRRARGNARHHFRVAEIHLRGNRPAKFFGELAQIINGHIEEWVGQSVQGMTRPEMREFLQTRSFEPSTIRQIAESLEAFDFARFAPTAAGPDEMRNALRRTRDLLKKIEATRVVKEQGEEEGAA